MKANAMKTASGEWVDVSKKPATDPAKGSKAGRQAVVLKDGELMAQRLDSVDPAEDRLIPVWRNGELLTRHTFDEVRARSEA